MPSKSAATDAMTRAASKKKFADGGAMPSKTQRQLLEDEIATQNFWNRHADTSNPVSVGRALLNGAQSMDLYNMDKVHAQDNPNNLSPFDIPVHKLSDQSTRLAPIIDDSQQLDQQLKQFDQRYPPGQARGGRSHLADGGYTPPAPSFGAREAFREEMSPTAGGVIQAEIPGRTDHVPMSPAANSFVVPADVVSGLGEGNTLAGARIMDEMLHSGPYGIRMTSPARSGGVPIPRPPAPFHFADGGVPHKAPLRVADTSDSKKPGSVPIMAAGGEYIIPPEVVQNHPLLGNGDMERGHAILRAWVVHERKKHIKTLSKLPGPHK